MKPLRFVAFFLAFVVATTVDVAKALVYLALFPLSLIPLIFWAIVRLAKVAATLVAIAVWVAFETAKLAVCTAFWWAFPLAVALLIPNPTTLKTVIISITSAVGMGLVGTIFSSTDIINTMIGILKAAGIRPLLTYAYQLPNDARTLGAIIVWISPDKKSFMSVRDAANLAGLWFCNVKYLQNTSSIGWVISVFVAQDKNKMS